MNEDIFNMELRKFLKKVGVTSQRVIEEAVREGLDKGTLAGKDSVKAQVVLTVEGTDVRHTVDGEISFK
ncbi:MAG TPA: DUF6494 family protein [Kiloniellales bacterium]|nr:DUF6494 family protein [Kiloniellales bacterium]